jgi:hypothetical protein
MGTIYLVNILNKILIYSKYTLISVTILLRLFMLIILLEYTWNMVVHIHSKYTFINISTPKLYSLEFTKYTFVYS